MTHKKSVHNQHLIKILLKNVKIGLWPRIEWRKKGPRQWSCQVCCFVPELNISGHKLLSFVACCIHDSFPFTMWCRLATLFSASFLFLVPNKVPCSISSYKVHDDKQHVSAEYLKLSKSFQWHASDKPFFHAFVSISWRRTSSHVMSVLFILVVRLSFPIQYDTVLLAVVFQDSVFLL